MRTEPTKTGGESVRRTSPSNQTSHNLCQHMEAKTTKKGVGAFKMRTMARERRLSECIPLRPPFQSRSGMPNSTWAWLFWLLPLIILSDNVDTSAGPDRVIAVPRPNESAKRSAAADENKPSWKSNALATTKLLLPGVRDSADAFGPLKSVVRGLCFIL